MTCRPQTMLHSGHSRGMRHLGRLGNTRNTHTQCWAGGLTAAGLTAGRKASWPSLLLTPRQHSKDSVQRAARALLSGLGEHEAQTFLFHLTNRSFFQGRFSSAQAGERQTCRGMIWAGRQQINQADPPVSLMEKGEEAFPASGQREMCW